MVITPVLVTDCTSVAAGVDVAVKLVIAVPPVSVGAVNATVELNGPVAVAVPIVGAAGTVNGVMLELVLLFKLLPTRLVA
jgi:hypothetical protein